MFYRLWTTAALLLYAACGTAAQTQAHEHIRDTARSYVMDSADRFAGRIDIRVGELDARLKLAQCSQPLEAYESPNGLKAGRTVIGVRCSGAKPWKLYVPVQIALPRKVVLSRRPLARGVEVTRDDLWLSERDTATMHTAFYTDPEPLVGMRTRRALGRDRVITANMLQRSRLVQRGSTVLLRSGSAAMLAQMKGKALADGGRGDRVRVKNISSGRVVTGVVVDAGVVEVRH